MLEKSGSLVLNARHRRECVDNLQTQGWWFSNGERTQEGFGLKIDAEWMRFAEHWSRLLRDEYMRDGGTYRYRRYSSFTYDNDSGNLTQLPHAPYEQSATINTLNGGFQRHFEPLEQSFIANRVFISVLTNFGTIFSDAADHARWNVKIHPYRIVAREGVVGEPAPEGLYKDGVDFIVSYLVNRVNVSGGVSVVTDNEKQVLGEVELSRSNDFVVGNDKMTYHGVSPVALLDPKKPFAYRDVLVIAFEKI